MSNYSTMLKDDAHSIHLFQCSLQITGLLSRSGFSMFTAFLRRLPMAEFRLNAFSGVSRCSKSKLPWGRLLYQSLNSSMKRKLIDGVDIHQNHRSNFPFVWGCFTLAKIGLMPCRSRCFLKSLSHFPSSWMRWALNSAPWSIMVSRIGQIHQYLSTSWSTTNLMFSVLAFLELSTGKDYSGCIIDDSANLEIRPTWFMPQSICPADRLCSLSYRTNLRRFFFCGFLWARSAALRYMWIRLWDIRILNTFLMTTSSIRARNL